MVATDEPMVVAGGGLVGSLLALFLARRGARVVVHERRLALGDGPSGGGRSINLVLTRRGVRALERVGFAEPALALTVPVRGRMMHDRAGRLTYQPYGRDESECNYSVSRGGLNELLLREAGRRGVELRFGSRVVAADPEHGRLELHDETTGAASRAEGRVVFGADGAGSVVRQAFRSLPAFRESVELLRHGYKELTIPAGPDGSWRIEPNALHIWPRGELMLMALPNLDRSFTVTLYLPHAGARGVASITDAGRLRALFEAEFPDAVELIPDLEREFFDHPTGELGTVRCAPWHAADRTVLIGDAAHAIVPFFGQGMNTGFEDCTVLDELLEQAGREPDWAAVLGAFFARRKPDADAIAEMALENFVEMRDRVADPAFLLRKRVEARLEREMPESYRSRYALVMYTHLPMHLAREAGRIQDELLDELCRGLDGAERLDMERARALVGERFVPFLAEHGIRLEAR